MDSSDWHWGVVVLVAVLAITVIAWATYTVITERDDLTWDALAIMAALVVVAIGWAIGLAVHESADEMRGESRD